VSVEFLRPLCLLLMPLGIAAAGYIGHRFGRRGSLKYRVSLGMRCLLISLCALVLAAPTVLLSGGSSAAWLLVDASDSARSLQGRITESAQTALREKSPRLEAGVIAFGANAMVEMPLSAQPEYHGVRTAVLGQDTDLGAALTLAGALLPAEAGGRIAVLSDGMAEDAAAAAKALSARGIAVDVMPFAPDALPDAQISQVQLPASAYAGQAFSVTVRVDANMDAEGTLVLYQNRQPVDTRAVTVRRGENVFVFRDVARAAGVVTYEARLIAAGDECTQNDSLGAYLYVQGAPRLLLVEGRSGEGSEMSALLNAAGLQHDTILPAQLPDGAEGLQGYDGIVLVNVDHDAAQAAQWEALRQAVRALGRGLTVIGGDSSYALGGYRGTELEEMLPVTIDVRSKLDMPSLALMLVIDKSGSMTEGMFGTTRLELAKEAAMRAAEVLTENDRVGVIAFDDAAKWVVSLQAVEDVAAIQRQIGTIRPGGGTAFYSALLEAKNALTASDAAQKHVIFLTDGEPGDSGYEALVDGMRQNGITLTTVAVGSGADQRLLRSLAERGGGRAYAADEFDNLPKIFTKETYLVSGSYVQNRSFYPVITHDSVLTDFEGFPRLDGYLAATEKGMAEVELVSDREDPLLAWWQYGAGRVLCFMGDSRGAWTGELLAWDQAAAFYGGMAAFTLPAEQRSGELAVERSGGQLLLRYTAPEEGGGLDTQAQALLPDGSQTAVALTETAQGIYTGSLPAEQTGAYALRVEQRGADGSLERAMESGAVAAYSREYDLRRQRQEGVLERLAALTGGQVITDPAQLLRREGARAYRRVELSTGLLWALLALLVADVALRRLPWETAVEKWLKKRTDAKPTREKREKPSAPPPEKKAPARPEPADTAGALLEKQKNRKIL